MTPSSRRRLSAVAEALAIGIIAATFAAFGIIVGTTHWPPH